MSDTKSNNDAREERILKAAAQLIMHYGYDKTTVSDIAREAGISKGAIYLHWSSKEALFEALYTYEGQRFAEDWAAAFETQAGDWSFVKMFELMWQTMEQHPFMMALHTRDQRVLGSLLQRNKTLLQQKSTANSELFQQLQAVGAARDDIDPQVIAFVLNIMSYGLLKIGENVEPEDMPPFEVLGEALGKILDRGLEPENGGNRKAARKLVLGMVDGIQQQMAKEEA